ncbi:MAG: AbrB/MazE/SpoVT family DNA-binding domain-containing protein [Desulforhopalus sp.]
MKASIIKIGNSQGVRIPKPILDQCGFNKEVELEVINQKLIIKAAKSPRKNWEASFKKMAENKDDQLLDSSMSTEWENEDWEW